MNEAETRAELIDPKLKACGWGVVEGTKILREHVITDGRIQAGSIRAKPLIADYVLVYKGIKLAVVEAKSSDLAVGEGIAQAKLYAEKLNCKTTYSSNGKETYSICMETGNEGLVEEYLSPEELWNKTFTDQNLWRENFNAVPFEDISGTKTPRYYQEIATNNVLEAIAKNKERILLTLATGTGKTFIAFQIAWKLFQSRWNLRRDGSRRPRILFLTDRNILTRQAMNSFNEFMAFPEDSIIRIKPSEIRKKGKVPTNGSIFFTIFQTFMSGKDKNGEPAPYFGEYPQDYFDFIIIDECHRGGANNEGNWRGILDYFSPAVQLGLTATPKRKDNVDTYRYFGEPVYIYSLKEGINDGFLTPFKVKRIKTTLDDYIYTSDDQLIEGEVEEGKRYIEKDFNRIIEIEEREAKRVKVYMDSVDQNEKTIIFCATQKHASAVRNLVNQNKKNKDVNYCVRVTANDGARGEQFLREFQSNKRTIPTILTTSKKLSTGVDARNIRNIVLMRPVNSMIEFKQIVGRGTRLFDGKEFFTIYDFVDAYHHFADPEWDGKPLEPDESNFILKEKREKEPKVLKDETGETKKKIKIKLRDGKYREIQHMVSTSFWSAEGKPISSREFLQKIAGDLPKFFKDESELCEIWGNHKTRKELIGKLFDIGYDKEKLSELKKIIYAEKSDLFDVLRYISFAIKPITREERVKKSLAKILKGLDEKQKEFIEFVLSKYIESGVKELDEKKLPSLLELKYKTINDAKRVLGGVSKIRSIFLDFQKFLY